jgi:hypothetical protein
MELLKQRGIPYIIYTAEDWDSDAKDWIDLSDVARSDGGQTDARPLK